MKPRLNFRICRLYFRHRVIPSVSELWLWMDPQNLTISYGHISWWRMALNLTGTPIFKRCKKSISTHLVGLKPERLNWPPFTHFFFCVYVARSTVDVAVWCRQEEQVWDHGWSLTVLHWPKPTYIHWERSLRWFVNTRGQEVVTWGCLQKHQVNGSQKNLTSIVYCSKFEKCVVPTSIPFSSGVFIVLSWGRTAGS